MRADTACSVHVISQGADESSLPDFSDDERAYQEKSWNSMIGCCIARHFAAEAYAKGEDKVIMNKVSSSTSQCMCASSWAPPTLRCLNPLLPCKDHHGAALRKVQGDVQGPVLPHHPKVLSGIEPGTVRAPRKILDAAIVETKTCKYVADCGSLFVCQ